MHEFLFQYLCVIELLISYLVSAQLSYKPIIIQLHIRNGNCLKPRQSDALKLFGGQDAFTSHFVMNTSGETCPRNSPAQHKKKRSIAGIAIGGNRTYSYPSSPVSVAESCMPSPKNRRLEWTLTGTSETADSCGSTDSLDLLPPTQPRSNSASISDLTRRTEMTKRLTFPETVSLFQTFNLGMRKDLMELFFEWSVPVPLKSDCETLSVADRAVTTTNLIQFMETEQLESCTPESARQIIENFENDEHLRSHYLLSFEGFAAFMSNASNFAFLSENLAPKEEDMHHPLSHYYIASSHNTYLTGHQLKGSLSSFYHHYFKHYSQ